MQDKVRRSANGRVQKGGGVIRRISGGGTTIRGTWIPAFETITRCKVARRAMSPSGKRVGPSGVSGRSLRSCL